MNILTIILLAILAVALLPLAICAGKAAGRRLAANAGLTHPDGIVSLKPSAAITTRFLIGKRGASASLVAVTTAGDQPLCIIQDTATADDVTLGTPIACALLGATKGTKLVVGGGVIAADVDVYAIGAAGKVGTLAQAATGDWRIGRSAEACAADGDAFAIIPQLPTYQKPA